MTGQLGVAESARGDRKRSRSRASLCDSPAAVGSGSCADELRCKIAVMRCRSAERGKFHVPELRGAVPTAAAPLEGAGRLPAAELALLGGACRTVTFDPLTRIFSVQGLRRIETLCSLPRRRRRAPSGSTRSATVLIIEAAQGSVAIRTSGYAGSLLCKDSCRWCPCGWLLLRSVAVMRDRARAVRFGEAADVAEDFGILDCGQAPVRRSAAQGTASGDLDGDNGGAEVCLGVTLSASGTMPAKIGATSGAAIGIGESCAPPETLEVDLLGGIEPPEERTPQRRRPRAAGRMTFRDCGIETLRPDRTVAGGSARSRSCCPPGRPSRGTSRRKTRKSLKR